MGKTKNTINIGKPEKHANKTTKTKQEKKQKNNNKNNEQQNL